jgi:hypothetical protein
MLLKVAGVRDKICACGARGDAVKSYLRLAEDRENLGRNDGLKSRIMQCVAKSRPFDPLPANRIHPCQANEYQYTAIERRYPLSGLPVAASTLLVVTERNLGVGAPN